MSVFDYEYTCPKLDGIQSDISSVADDLLNDVLTALDKDELSGSENNAVKAAFENFEAQLSNLIDDARNVNSDMRDAAELQIQEALDRVEELQSEVDNLESELASC